MMGSKAYGLLWSLLAPTNPAEKNFEDLVKVMKNHLNTKLLVIAKRFKFHERNQKEGETIAEYLAALRKVIFSKPKMQNMP